MKLIRALGLFVLLAFMLSSAVLAQDATEEPAGEADLPTPLPAEAVAGPGREIQIGTTVTGTLGPNSPTVIYNFIAQAGYVVTISMESSLIDSYLRLGDQRGNQLLADDDSGEDLNARIGPVRLPEDGAYVVIASSFENAVSEGAGSDIGDFTLTVTAYEPEAISIPATVEGTLASGEVLTIYSFEASMGDILRISLDSDDFDPLVTLTEANNITSPTLRDDDSGPGHNALIVPYIVPASGTYYLTAVNFDSRDSGDYTLTVEILEPTPIAYDDVAEASLTYHDQAAGIYLFEAAEGEIIDIVVESPTDLDTTLTVLGPDGSQVAFNDDAVGRNPALLGLELPGAGNYTFVVQPFSRNSSGDITVQVAPSRGS